MYICIYVCMDVFMHAFIYGVVLPTPPPAHGPLYLRILILPPLCGLWCGYSATPPVVWCGVVGLGCLTLLVPLWCGGGFWDLTPSPPLPLCGLVCCAVVVVSGLVFNPLPPSLWCGGCFVWGLHPRPPVVRWWVLGYLTPLLPPSWWWWVVGFRFSAYPPSPPPCGVVVGVGFRV